MGPPWEPGQRVESEAIDETGESGGDLGPRVIGGSRCLGSREATGGVGASIPMQPQAALL